MLRGDGRPIFVRGAFDYDGDLVSDETGLLCEDDSLADQSQRDDADINVIVARMLAGQPPPEFNAPVYGDFTGIGDFREAQDAVRVASEMFMEMPASLRAKFHNDPQELLDFVSDDSNHAEAKKLGIVVKGPEVPVPSPA